MRCRLAAGYGLEERGAGGSEFSEIFPRSKFKLAEFPPICHQFGLEINFGTIYGAREAGQREDPIVDTPGVPGVATRGSSIPGLLTD